MSARNQLIDDLFVTACEGGINYWASVSQYHWTGGELLAVIHDMEDDGKTYTVDRKVMSRGYRLACGEWRDRLAWSTARPPLVVTERTRDEWDFDAYDADMILQLGIFGDVVYG